MKRSSSLQAVIFAGGVGSRMQEITSSIPKCLLPVVNKPLLWYPLTYLKNAGFAEMIVLLPSKCVTEVKALLSSMSDFNAKVDLVPLQDDQDGSGTADALRLIADRIQGDVLLLTCDLITDFPLNELITKHQVTNSELTCLLATKVAHATPPGPKHKRKIERDVIGIVPEDQRLVFMSNEDDLEDDALTLSRNFLIKFPKANFTMKLTDCHLYIMKKSVIDLLSEDDELSSIKNDLIPFLLSLQYSGNAQELQTLTQNKITDNSVTSCNDECALLCTAYVANPSEYTFCARLNNYGSYFEANKQIVRLFPKWVSTETIKGVPADCAVGQSTTVKGVLKRSVIGRECMLNDQCKITNSLLMDCVRVGAGATVTNSIICCSVDIGDNAEITDCIIGLNQQIVPLGKVALDIVSDTSKLMDI